MELSSHFQTNDSRNPTEVLTAFDLNSVARTDGHVEVLSYASKTSANSPSSAENASERHGRGLGVVGGAHVGRSGDFDERQSESVQVVHDLLAVGQIHRVQFTSAVLLQTHNVNTDRSFFGGQNTVGSDERGTLKSTGVGAVNHRFSHRLNQRDGLGLEQRCHGQCDVKRLLVQSDGWLFVQLDQPGVGGLGVDEGSVSF